ncbi:MAG: hypothetical protein ACM3H9_02145, partial [Rhodospirillaceae bacterium]
MAIARPPRTYDGRTTTGNPMDAATSRASVRDEARDVAASIGFPVVVRPSYVLGGRAMAIVYDPGALDRYMTTAGDASP